MQEQTRQQELRTKQAEAEAAAAAGKTEYERVHWDEQRKFQQTQAQARAQLAQYEDDLARKRQQARRLRAPLPHALGAPLCTPRRVGRSAAAAARRQAEHEQARMRNAELVRLQEARNPTQPAAP